MSQNNQFAAASAQKISARQQEILDRKARERKKKIIIRISIIAVALLLVAAIAIPTSMWGYRKSLGWKTGKPLPIATIEVEGFGTMTIELRPDKAPETVNNFISLANSGKYDGLTFHRVAEDFMIQGGDPKGNGSGDRGYYINGEFSSNGFKQNNLKHELGVISMARSTGKDSAGCQFFICNSDSVQHLDGEYAAFGKVVAGFDVLEKISKIETTYNDRGEKDVPLSPPVIKSITVDTQGVKYPSPIKIKKPAA